MAHFAEIDDNNVVQRVIVVSDRNTSDSEGNESEDIGVAYCRSLYGPDTDWKQCSFSHRIRKVFPSVGMLYSSSMDLFHLPRPHASWTLNSEALWVPPVTEPGLTQEQIDQGYFYTWNEDQYQADPANGWSLTTPQIISIGTQPTDVSVAVGNSVDLTSVFSVNRGSFTVMVEYNPDGEEIYWGNAGWTEAVGNSDSSLNATNSSGIVTSTDAAGKYRLRAFPENLGNSTISNTITLTVTE